MGAKVSIVTPPLPVVVIVGRPNVGKSTLFNRIIGLRKAVVSHTPGLTRDRNYARTSWEGKEFLLVDTGGYEPDSREEIFAHMREQTRLAIEEADLVLFLTDVSESLNPLDEDIVHELRTTRKSFFLVVNKCDDAHRKAQAYDFSRFGVSAIYPISSMHGVGISELLDDTVAALPQAVEVEDHAGGIRIAVVGRQNVGKSTLINSLLGQKRLIAHATPGTTRDAIDTTFELAGRRYKIIDTAGIRRRGKIARGIERLAVASSIMGLERCDVALLVLDAQAGVVQQDTHIGGYALEAGKPCVIVVNKWDAIEKTTETSGAYVKILRRAFNFLPDPPISFVSALTGQRVATILPLVDQLYSSACKEVSTPQLNKTMERVLKQFPPPARKGKTLKIHYATQTGILPPTFTLFVNDPGLVHFSYQRYLVNQLREAFEFEGVPIRLKLRGKTPRRSRKR
jgi:GTP-binding protein